LAQGSRIDPLLIAITTAGVRTDRTGQDSIAYRRYQYGLKVASGEIDDPSFFMIWFGAPDDCDYRDPKVWEAANPGYGDLIDPENFKAVLGRVSEYAFKNKYLNMWTSSVQAWLPHGAWAKCKSDEPFTPGERGVVLGFDGSRSGDTTALVAVTVEAEPQVKVINCWEKPQEQIEWKVPRQEVKDTIRQACRDYEVREIAADELHLARRTRRADGRRLAGGFVPAERLADGPGNSAVL
jgi:phage terminase large subunit-like protein